MPHEPISKRLERLLRNYSSHNFQSNFSRIPNFLFNFIAPIICIIIITRLFWSVPQAQDLMIAYTEGTLIQKIMFISAFYFFVIMLWYSSRLIVRARTLTEYKLPGFYKKFLPPLLGFLCFPIMQSAVKQLPYLNANAWTTGQAFMYLLAHVFFFFGLIWLLERFMKAHGGKPARGKIPIVTIRNIFMAASVVIIVASFGVAGFSGRINGLFYLLIALELAYVSNMISVFFMPRFKIYPLKNSRPGNQVKDLWAKIGLTTGGPERHRFRVFAFITLIGLIIYFISVLSIPFVLQLGTFCYFFLALGVIACVYNFVYFVSILQRTNIFFLLIILVMILGFWAKSTYDVRLQKAPNENEFVYGNQSDLKSYLKSWIELRAKEIDSAKREYPLYFVLSDGGASRSAYWVASVLAKLEQETKGEFSHHLFCLSGASGGSLGNATFYSLLFLNQTKKANLNYFDASRQFLKNDFLSFTLARMMGGDLYNYFSPGSLAHDRAAALEKSMEYFKKDSVSKMMASPFSQFALQSQPGTLPILCINTTRMQDGGPAVISTIKIKNDSTLFNNRVDVLSLLKKGEDINLSTAVVLGARFPYVSPAGNLHGNYFVDGGYFDNSGSGFVHELIRAIRLCKDDPANIKRIAKFRYYVIHISNSPSGTTELKKISKLGNDLASPLKTLTGAYGMQTTINDKRLMQYLSDIGAVGDSLPNYFLVPLYREKLDSTDPYLDKRTGKEFPYPMNWYISDTAFRRMKNQINHCAQLDALIANIKTHFRYYE